MQTATTGSFGSQLPEAYVSAGRNRQKIYNNNKIYMKSGTEFSVELFNPTSKTVGAKIYINGQPISNNLIVIKPGRREYLDRFIDDNRKFVFDTYEVDGNDAAAIKAIAVNGFVRIEFYNEQTAQPLMWYGGTAGNYQYPTTTITTTPFPYFGSTCDQFTVDPNNLSGLSGTSCSTASCANNDNATYTTNCFVNTRSVETGRVEAGGTSDQSFNTYHGSFEYWACASAEYQILPESMKPLELNKVRQYCTGCGTRVRKSTWKFCPACGSKID